MKRIETMIDLLTHLITTNSDRPFNEHWDLYFSQYHEKYGIGNMSRNELEKWLNEEVEEK